MAHSDKNESRVSQGGEGRIRRGTPEEQRAIRIRMLREGTYDVQTQRGWDLAHEVLAEELAALTAERDRLAKESVDETQRRIANWNRLAATAREAERARDEAWAALAEIAHYLDGDHSRAGEACGVDACVLCLARERARAVLAARDVASEQVPDGPRDLEKALDRAHQMIGVAATVMSSEQWEQIQATMRKHDAEAEKLAGRDAQKGQGE